MKCYDEIADAILKRRDEYNAKQKRKKRMIINTAAAAVCCCVVLASSFGLRRIEGSDKHIPITDSSQSNSPNNAPSKDSHQNNSSKNTYSQNTPSSDSHSSSDPSSSSRGESVPNDTPSTPDDHTDSSTPPSTETNYFIDSIDKVNFYAAKKIISENALLPIGMKNNFFSLPNTILLNDNYIEYPIDRNKVFTVTMVTYFTAKLNDERGFLAQKLGGTGLIEIVVTDNNIDDMGQMITFKRSDNYYTCFMNNQENAPNSDQVKREFSSHKYIEGFHIVKNFEQENYKFIVNYEGARVVGFACEPFQSTPSKYHTDDVTFIDDFCVVLFTKQYFTIDQLELYFKNEKTEDLL